LVKQENEFIGIILLVALSQKKLFQKINLLKVAD